MGYTERERERGGEKQVVDLMNGVTDADSFIAHDKVIVTSRFVKEIEMAETT